MTPNRRSFNGPRLSTQAGEYACNFRSRTQTGFAPETDVRIVIDNVNRPPVLAVSDHAAILGRPLSFVLAGTDADLGTTLTYAADDLPSGATLDSQTGRFDWTPGPGQAGQHVVVFTVSDGATTVSRSTVIQAAITSEPPQVSVEMTPSFAVVPGQRVLLHAFATSLADIVSVELMVNGLPIALDDQGRGTFIPQDLGRSLVEATATDADGLVGHKTTVLKVRDPNDVASPVVAFSVGLDGARLTSAIDVLGNVSDSNLDSWLLEQAPLGHGSFTSLASGHSAVSGPLTRFDPTAVANGFYRLRLTASDITGRVSRTEIVVEANSSDKPTQYQRTETDFNVLLGGTTIELVRSYDSLSREQQSTFGFGWRLANRDLQIETNVLPTNQESLGVYNPFQIGTRLYLNLPQSGTAKRRSARDSPSRRSSIRFQA